MYKMLTYVLVMIAPHVVRELVTEHPPDLLVRAEAVVPVRPQPELDCLPRVHVQPEEMRLLVRRELGEHPDRELVLAHHVPDGGVVRELREEAARGLGIGEVREGLDAVECVLGACGRGRACGPYLVTRSVLIRETWLRGLRTLTGALCARSRNIRSLR